MLDGVGGEILHHLPDAAFIGGDGVVAEAGVGDAQLLGLQCKLQLVKHAATEGQQGEFVPGQLHAARLQTAQIQHFQHHVVHPFGFGEDDFQIFLPFFLSDMLLQSLGIAVDDGQGCFQLVGDVGGHLPPVFLRLFGVAEGGAQTGDLVFSVSQRLLRGAVVIPQCLQLRYLRRAVAQGGQMGPAVGNTPVDFVQGLGQLPEKEAAQGQTEHQYQCGGKQIDAAEISGGDQQGSGLYRRHHGEVAVRPGLVGGMVIARHIPVGAAAEDHRVPQIDL